MMIKNLWRGILLSFVVLRTTNIDFFNIVFNWLELEKNFD